MRDHQPGRTRDLIGVVLLGVASCYLAPYLLALAFATAALGAAVAAYLLYRAYAPRHRPPARPRTAPAPAVCDVLYSGPPTQLIGHTDRDTVIDRLGDRYATGHLTADEFEARADEATRARTRGQLAHVLRDLP